MRFSYTFSFYVIRNLLLNLLYVLLTFMFIAFIIDFLELIREAQGTRVLINQMLQMSFYKTPFLVFSFFPFIFLFGSILTFTKLNNSYELIAAKCAGISIWSISIPIALVVVILSSIILWVFQPISAILLDNNRILGTKYFGYQAKRVSFQSNGVWIFDQNKKPEDDKIIFIQHVKTGKTLEKVSIYSAGTENNYTTSYSASSVTIENMKLILNDVTKKAPGIEPKHYKHLSLKTGLSENQIQQDIPHPDIIPFWKLNRFINKIKQSGFSALRHELYYQSMLATPLLYLSLVLIALSCSINLPRKGKLGIVFVTGGMIGIFIFFIDKIANVMALTGVLPVTLAAITPGCIYLLLSIAILIHFEES
jgi:lipopolysaccharide export system permease protein